jgi:hypothetical protein
VERLPPSNAGDDEMKTTIDMAREVKATAYTNRHYPDRTTYTFGPEQLQRFEALVRADERALAAPVQEPVKWSDHEPDGRRYPAVPDAFGTREGEHPQYIQGWNDCRAEMLKGMK